MTNIKNKLLVIVTLFIYLSFAILSNRYIDDMKYQNIAANQYFSQTSIEVYNDEYAKNYIHNLKERSDISFSLNIVNEADKIRKTAIFGDVCRPRIVKGKYFSEQDHQNDAGNYAVVSEESGKKIGDRLAYEGNEYEVIGLFKDMGLQSDDLVFVNLKDDEIENSSVIKIDFSGNSKLYDAVMHDTDIRESSTSSIMFFDSLPERMIFALVQILFCLSILVVMYFYVEDKKEEIRIKSIFGYSFSKIYIDGLLELMICLLTAWVISSVLLQDLSDWKYLVFATGLSAVALYISICEMVNQTDLGKKYENKK